MKGQKMNFLEMCFSFLNLDTDFLVPFLQFFLLISHA